MHVLLKHEYSWFWGSEWYPDFDQADFFYQFVCNKLCNFAARCLYTKPPWSFWSKYVNTDQSRVPACGGLQIILYGHPINSLPPGVHYGDVIMGAIASQITSLTIVYSTVYSDADQRKHQSSASLAFVRGLHRGPVNSPYKWPVTGKMFPFDDVFME